MFCENCGNKLDTSHKFCTKCGHSNIPAEKNITKQTESTLDDRWWHRLLKVLYIAAYLPLLIIIPVVWSENSYSYYSGDTYGEAFWYSLLTLIIWVVILRLIKIAVLYVAIGRKPEWKREFKKLT